MANNFSLLILGGHEALSESAIWSGICLLKQVSIERHIPVIHLVTVADTLALIPAAIAWQLDYVIVCGKTTSEELVSCCISLRAQGLQVIITTDSTEVDSSRVSVFDCLEKACCQLSLTHAVASLVTEGTSYVYAYQKADVAASVVVVFEGSDSILLIKRKHEPFKGCFALPGGFLRPLLEDLPACAVRELAEETGLKLTTSELIGVSVRSSPCRDTRGHVIDYGYCAVIQPTREAEVLQSLRAMDDAESVVVLPLALARCLPLAADHNALLEDALRVVAGERRMISSKLVQAMRMFKAWINRQVSLGLQNSLSRYCNALGCKF